MILLSLALLMNPAAGAPPPPAADPKVLVLPLQASGDDPSFGWVSEIVADSLARDLETIGVPVVTRVERLRAYEALEIPAVSLTRATAVREAEAVGVSRII